MAKVKAIFVGCGALAARLEGLTNAEAKRAIGGACREALKPMLADARSNAPRETGKLARNIKIKTIRSRRNVGARITINSSVNKSRYSFVIFGRKTGTKTSEARTQIAPNNFIKAAATARASDSVDLFSSIVGAHIKKVIGRRK